jgi:hypothetical protein
MSFVVCLNYTPKICHKLKFANIFQFLIFDWLYYLFLGCFRMTANSPYTRYSLSLIPPDTENLEKKPFQVIDFYSKTHLVLSAAHAFGPGGLSAVTNN